MVYLNLFMDECMIVIPPHPKHYNGEKVKSSPSSPLKQASARAGDPSSPSSLSSPYSPASCLTYRCGYLLCSPPRNLLGSTFVVKPNHNEHKDPATIRVAVLHGGTSNLSSANGAPDLLPVIVRGKRSAPGW